MGADSEPRWVRFLGSLTPTRVAFAGVAVVLFLLILPISTLGPGDHEFHRCGNALSIDLDFWTDVPDGEYLEGAFRRCTGQRVDRIARAVVVGSVTILIVTAMLARRAKTSPGGAGR